MIMLRRFIVFCFLLFLFIHGKAQQDRPMRVEIEAKSNSDNYNIIPFGKKGVLLFYQSDVNWQQGNANWIFSLYDVNFKEKWTKTYSDSKYMNLRLQDKDEDNLYLFLQKAVGKNQKDDFSIVSVNISSGEIRSVKGVNPDHSDVNLFKVQNQVAYCAGATVPSLGAEIGQVFFSLTLVPFFSGYTLLHYHPSFFMVDLGSGNISSIKEKPKGQAWVESMETNPTKQSLFLTIKNHIPSKKNFMYLNEYDAKGSKLSSMELSTNNKKRKLNTAKLLNLGDSAEIIIGSYNNKVNGYGANAASNAFKEYSSGIYFTRVAGGQQKLIKFYNFADIKSFSFSLNSNRALRLKQKEIRKKAQGKEISFDISMLLHDIIVKDSQYIFIAETYRPEYHNVSYTTYDYYGRPNTSTYSVFDGYRYSDAIIMSFDKEGNLLWDNSFEMNDVISMNLDERVEVMFSEDDIILTYSNEGEIASKIIRGSQVVEGNTSTPIQTNYKNDKLLSDYNSDMAYWYGSYFISYGYQRIKNTSPGDKSKRTVFYFNKIGFY
jgi:hypothetical protein